MRIESYCEWMASDILREEDVYRRRVAWDQEQEDTADDVQEEKRQAAAAAWARLSIRAKA
jgi:hypothetical protein